MKVEGAIEYLSEIAIGYHFKKLDEVIVLLKDQADEITSLKQQLAQNPDYLYVPRMEGTDGCDNNG